jgi:type IV secretory pathway VirJ component
LALPIPLDICTRPLEADDRQGSGTIEAPVLKNPWIVAFTPAASAETRAHFEALAAKTKLMQTRELPDPSNDLAFVDLVRPFLAPRQPSSVDGLPLVEMPATPRTRRMAIFISGDGGWRDVDKRVSEKLQQLGVSVVGWDSLRYFWRRKTPDQAAADLAAVIEAYQRKWGCDQIALIGFSFGSDVMPFIYDRLDESLRRRIVLISLLSPGQAADWEIRVAGWFGAGPSSEATPLAPAIAEMPGERVQCFYGDADRGNSCGLLGARGAQVIEKRGDHHMDGDYDLIGRQIFEALQQRLSAQR